MLIWPDFGTHILSCNSIGMSTAQYCLEENRKYAVQRQIWICETCCILCCKTVIFAELYPYQNIFVYLILSSVVDNAEKISTDENIYVKKSYNEKIIIFQPKMPNNICHWNIHNGNSCKNVENIHFKGPYVGKIIIFKPKM